jgi:hypothetical protein
MKCVEHDVFRTIEQIYHHGDFNYVLYNCRQ